MPWNGKPGPPETGSQGEHGGRRKAIYAWAGYDWANSAFTTLVVTFVYSAYFTRAIAPDPVSGTVLWSRAVAVSGLLIALLAPFLGLLADRGRNRHRYLIGATLVCIVATAALAFVAPGAPRAVWLALTIFVVANVAFEVGGVFYNAFLPDIAPPERLGGVSGLGWGLGYAGGLGCLALALVVLVRDTPLFGIGTALGFHYRATNLLVALWFLVFSLPMLALSVRWGKSRGDALVFRDAGGGDGARPRGLRQTFTALGRHRDTLWFLAARLVYNDGLVTVFAFGGIYAAGTFGMSLSEVIRFGIGINVAAALGAWVFGSVDDRFGGKRTILITLLALAGFTLLAALAPNRTWLWVAGLGIGVFAGPNQAASRALLGRFAPPGRRSGFFGLFAFSGKLTAFLGPLLMGVATGWAGSQRVGVATTLVFFVVGGALLLRVNEERGVARGRGLDPSHPGGKSHCRINPGAIAL
uniref:MFS transporter, UMF1 family n=1 Tax=Candidatus Kentrum eta TaxID=2126337 RepID=A0A450U5F9_9GAMM|nr:MAG: MFS transporter, UMF1 family [Candidatus Kentron sp. H]VFJ88283.1 MAG: MFS transporter, UMF1 family [Candidatus Kentron sp. H]VFJ95504.1 MAG: MFS transporter, UMF1 family [Candidatus Kentron sp. H]